MTRGEIIDATLAHKEVKGGVFRIPRELRGLNQFFMDLVHALLTGVTHVYKELYSVYLQKVGDSI